MCHLCAKKVPLVSKVHLPLVDSKGIPDGRILSMSKKVYDQIAQKVKGSKNEKLER